ncbi:MAG: hypothetical protein F4Z81_12345, partial [Gemmatimonadetes bacterium]|nr:hypothetical protein [Gemmatimonadota bacterium]
LSGEIPAEIGNLAKLERLGLSYNQLSGEIPAEIGNLAKLERLVLSHNQLSGEIPAEIGNLTAIEFLVLSSNQLSGEIPSEIDGNKSLCQLELNINQKLSGPLPVEITNLDFESPRPEIFICSLDLSGTNVCVPDTDLFDEWLERIERKTGITYCE